MKESHCQDLSAREVLATPPAHAQLGTTARPADRWVSPPRIVPLRSGPGQGAIRRERLARCGVILALGLTVATAEAQLIWTDRTATAGLGGNGYGVTHADGTFVLTGTTMAGGVFACSADGVTWTDSTGEPLSGGIYEQVAFGAGLFVAVGGASGATTVATSPDGDNWTYRTGQPGLPALGDLRTVEHNGSYFLAGGDFAGLVATIATSTDGIVWSNRTSGAGLTGRVEDAAYGNNRWVVVGLQGNHALIATSPNATSWTDHSMAVGLGGPLHGVASDGAQFVAVGEFTPSGGSTAAVILSSPDGETWADHTGGLGLGAILYDVTYANGRWVAVGGNSSAAIVAESTDGQNWTSTLLPIAAYLHDVAWGDGRWVAVGAVGAPVVVLTADDASNTTVSLGQNAIQFAAGTQTGSVSVIPSPANGTWSASTSHSWIHLLVASGTGSGTLQFQIAANPAFTARTGTIVVNGSTLTITQLGAVPAEPQTVSPEITTTHTITVQLYDPPSPVDGFRIERFTGLSWHLEATLGPNDREHQITGLAAWTDYRIRVVAFNQNGDSPPHEITVRTNPDCPHDLTVTPRNWTQVEVSWADVPGAHHYALERRIGAGGTWTSFDVPAGQATRLEVGLPADTEIAYRITTKPFPPDDSGRWSDRSPEIVSRTGVYAGTIYWGDAEAIPIGPPPQQDLFAVAFGAGRYVAVGMNGEIVSSPDGLTWQRETSWTWTSQTLSDVTYGDGKFVAVGNGGTILSSTGDGTWIPSASGLVTPLTRVSFGGGHFVATSPTGTMLRSSDGITWTPQPVSYQTYALSFGNGEFILLHSTNGTVCTSPDGSSWTEVRASGGFRLDFAFGSGLWVGVGSGGFTTWDGQTWTDGSLPTQEILRAIVHGDGCFLAVGMRGFGGTILTSTDGTSWSSVAGLPAGIVFSDLAWGDSGYVAVGTGGVVWHSAGCAASWTEVRPAVPTDGAGGALGAVDYGTGAAAGTVVAAGDAGLWRRDPSTRLWEEVQNFPNPNINLYGVSFANGRFYLTGEGYDVFTSVDGISWSTVSLPQSYSNYQDVEYGQGRLVAISNGHAFYSDDRGTTWTPAVGDLWANLRDLDFHRGVWVANRLDQDPILVSSDGIHWDVPALIVPKFVIAGAGDIAHGHVFGIPAFVALAAGETHLSMDGQVWIPNAHPGFSLACGDGVFVTGNSGGRLFASVDGVHWEPAPEGFLPPIDNYYSIAYGGNAEFTAVGPKREIHTFRVSASPLTRRDDDGVPDATEEAAPNGGDGNSDGTFDADQPHVASLPTFTGDYLTIAAPAGQTLSGVAVLTNPSPSNPPAGSQFPLGFLTFTIFGVPVGGSTIVELHIPPSVQINAYYKYGATPDNPLPHWYKFDYDPVTHTGAIVTPGLVILHFVDGQRGDDDLTANGTIVDDGGAAVVTTSPGGAPVQLIEFLRDPEAHVRVVVATDIGTTYSLHISDDLSLFQIRATIQATAPETEFIDAEVSSHQYRFYRVVEQE